MTPRVDGLLSSILWVERANIRSTHRNLWWLIMGATLWGTLSQSMTEEEGAFLSFLQDTYDYNEEEEDSPSSSLS